MPDKRRSSMADIAALEAELNKMILEGKAADAFEKFYAEDVVMQEPTDAPRVGKPANRKAEQEFYGNIEEFFGAKLLSSAVGDGVTFSEWSYDFKLKGQPRIKLEEVARREWQNGKIVHERFYYHRAG
jgi:ketosteroid isomerase-like protein